MESLPATPAWLRRVTIIGVGLLGGSVALALRRRGIHVTGYSRRESTRRAAVDCRAVDQATDDLAQACDGADGIVVAAPVHRIAALVCDAAGAATPDALITDVGSTKSRIVAEVHAESVIAAERFVAAHPIAGSEKTGVESASRSLFDGRTIVVTPSASNEADRIERACEFWRQTGGVVFQMTPQQHDQRLAAVSHVPHLVSSLLASLLEPDGEPLIGSGWRDMTRVAAGDPEMWTAICRHNRSAILSEIDRFAGELDNLRERIETGDASALQSWLQAAKDRKDATRVD